MGEGDNPISNLNKNLNTNQKIGFIIGIILIIALLIFLLFFLSTLSNSTNESIDDGNESPTTYIDDQGYTVTTETHINEQGEEITTGTREDPYGNVTTLDPNLITTYFPYQVMREHKDWNPTLRYFLAIDQKKQIIYANMEDCDVENDKVLISQYLNSIPIDLSDYTVEYELTSTNTDCGP